MVMTGWLVLALAGCSNGPQLPELPQLTTASTLAPLGSALKIEPSVHSISSAEAYSRVARGANACWFGPRGRLASSHIFHADAAPVMNGGAVEITVHERAVAQPTLWGYKAFRIAMTTTAGLDGAPGGGGTRIGIENLRMPDAEAARMRAETVHWAGGTEGCKEDAAADQELSARFPPPPPPPAAPVTAKAKATKAQTVKASSPAAGR